MKPLLLLLGLVACGPKQAPEGLVPSDLPVSGVRYQNAHLLPLGGPELLGGFVPSGVWPVGPEDVQRTACSEHFQIVEQPAAPLGQAVFGAAPSVAGQRGLEGEVAWADVRPDRRLVAAIGDPAALARCCAADPGACTEQYVAEVLTGEGRLYRPVGEVWYLASRVAGRFGFRLGGNPYEGPDCGAWQQGPPHAVHGAYFLGVSTTTFAEATARSDASTRATQQARSWLRERGLGDGRMADVREERWCVESFPDGDGTSHLAHVLLYLPEAD